MKLGAFSISLTVKDLLSSKESDINQRTRDRIIRLDSTLKTIAEDLQN